MRRKFLLSALLALTLLASCGRRNEGQFTSEPGMSKPLTVVMDPNSEPESGFDPAVRLGRGGARP